MLKPILAVLGAILIFLLCWLTIRFYYVFKRKWAGYKARAEVVFIGFAILVSFIAKLFVFLELNKRGNSVESGISLIWHTIYATIGGLTFEGLEDVSEIAFKYVFWYYGTSLYAGLITLTIATLGLSYELYSYVRLLRREKNKDIYVFTSLTEETLQLAKSIKQNDIETSEKENRAKGKNKKGESKSVIVFSGYDLKAFDKHDDLCRQVVMEGFLYWSFYKRNGKIKNIKKKRLTDIKAGNCEDRENYTQFDSLAKILHLNNKNIRRENNEKFQERRFCILAFESNKHIPEEENNIGLVVDDIKSRISCIEKDNLRIEYYILTKRDINYQAYIQRQKELVIEFAEALAKNEEIIYQEDEGNKKQKNKSQTEANATEKENKKQNPAKIGRETLAKLKNARMVLLNKAFQYFAQLLGNIDEEEIKKFIWDYYCDKYLKDWSCSLGEILITDEDFNMLFSKDKKKFEEELKEIKKELATLKSKKEEVFKYLELKEEYNEDKKKLNEELNKLNLGKEADLEEELNQLEENYNKGIALERLELQIKHWKNYFTALKKEYCKHFVVTAINEALIISKDVITDLKLPFEEIGYKENLQGGEKLIAYLLGFGSTGQAIARALHMRSAYINNKGYATETHFEVFDGKANEISGLFAKEHPMWICDGAMTKQDKLDYVYGKNFDNELLKREIIIPTVCFHKDSCFDLSIIDKLDNVTGKGEEGAKGRPSVIAIALGSDYDNIRMANALIADIIREENGNGNDVPQTIVVNIWDSNNNMLVDTCGGVWSNNHKILKYAKNNLTVRIVGNNTDIYSYNKMLAHDKDADYNEGYNLLYNYIFGGEAKEELGKKINELENCFQDKDSDSCAALTVLYSIIWKADSHISNSAEGYEKIDMWKRESNSCVRSVGKMFDHLTQIKINELKDILSIIDNKEKLKEKQKAIVDLYSYLSKVEHQRWLRCYIANGWQYSKYKLEMRKYHNCIIPFSNLKYKNSLYNVINIIKMCKENGGDFNIIKEIYLKSQNQNNYKEEKSNAEAEENNENKVAEDPTDDEKANVASTLVQIDAEDSSKVDIGEIVREENSKKQKKDKKEG